MSAPVQHIQISNFKAFRSARIPIRPITLVYGQNSAGKSSVIDALVWAAHLGQTALPYVDFADWNFDFELSGSRLRLGRYEDFVHQKNPKKDISLRFSFGKEPPVGSRSSRDQIAAEVDDPIISCDLLFRRGNGISQFTLGTGPDAIPLVAVTTAGGNWFGKSEWKLENPVLKGYLMKVMAQFYRTIPQDCYENTSGQLKRWDSEKGWSTNEIAAKIITAVFENSTASSYFDLRFIPPKELPRALFSSPTHLYEDDFRLPEMDSLPTDSEEALIALIVKEGVQFCQEALYDKWYELIRPLRSLVQNTTYLGPLREALDTQKLRLSRPAPDPKMQDLHSINANSPARGWNLNTDSIRFVNQWLRKRATPDTNYELRVVSYKAQKGKSGNASRIILMDRNRGIEVGLNEVGSGIGQFLPILLAAATLTDRASLICVKQPELHLHPSLQSDIGDVFTHFALDDLGFNRKSFVIETHSEHLLLRIMRRMRETAEGRLPKGQAPVRPSDVAVIYVENLGKESIAREMPLNEKGELVRDWPGGFFEEGLREILY